MSERLVIAYLTSSYARASDTFIRDEVAALRAAGDDVITFSIRRAPESEVVDDTVAAERARTTYLLELPLHRFLTAALSLAARDPLRFGRALREAGNLRARGLRGQVWPFLYFVEACALAQMLRRVRVDHLHDHIAEGSASVAMIASLLSGVPYSFTVHGPSEWDVPTELALDVKAGHASFVVAISEHTQGQLRRWIGHQSWDKVHVVHCGVADTHEPSLQPSPVDGEIVKLVSVGRLAHEKGHLVLLKALCRMRDVGKLRVDLVGDGPERRTLESFTNRNGLADIVEFHGWQSGERVRAHLRASTALVMPSFAEGLPISIMEALLLGKPVVSSRVGGVAELVRPGVSGWLVNPGSVQQLEAALRELISLDPSERRRLGARGREDVLRNHDVSKETARLRALIHVSATTSAFAGSTRADLGQPTDRRP